MGNAKTAKAKKHKVVFGFRGFTLIELLVVISIIGLLASVVMASLNSARAKARDARKQADFKAMSTALQLFFDKTGRMPANNWCNPGVLCPGAGNWGSSETQAGYQMSMQELVDAGFLAYIPKSPGGEPYSWYNYGGGNGIGGIIVTALETIPDTTTGIPPSCRPFGQNWCSNLYSTKAYCICNPY